VFAEKVKKNWILKEKATQKTGSDERELASK
jgi:hypothetical protein